MQTLKLLRSAVIQLSHIFVAERHINLTRQTRQIYTAVTSVSASAVGSLDQTARKRKVGQAVKNVDN